MSSFRTLGLRREYFLVFLAVLTLIVVLAYYITDYIKEEYRTEERLELTERLGSFRYQLESVITDNMAMINGLSAFVAANPAFTDEEFNNYVAMVMSRTEGLVNMAAAPSLVIRNIYPLAGNEEALGLNYRERETQIIAVERAIQENALVLAGPLELVQGGEAFIGQAPVFLEQGELWGIVSAPVLTSTLYERAGLDEIRNFINIAIRGSDGLGAQGNVFLGDEAIFTNERAVAMNIKVGDGEWVIGGIPVSTNQLFLSELVFIQILTVLLCVLNYLGFFLLSKSKDSDVNHKEFLLANERFLQRVERVSLVGGWRIDKKRIFTELTTRTLEIGLLEMDKKKISLENWCHSFNPASKKAIRDMFDFALTHGNGLDKTLELKRLNGTVNWLNFQAEAQKIGSDLELIGAVKDVTYEERARQKIEFQNYYDGLTRLPNRLLLHDRMESAISRAKRNNKLVAVCFMDVDNFKSVNDSLGHKGGDEFLITIADRLRKRIRATDTVARYSGDEFVIVLNDLDSERYVVKVLDDLVELLGEPFEIGGRQVNSGVSVGVSFYPQDATSAEDLLLYADQAMYVVKKLGRNNWLYYKKEMQAEAEIRNELYHDLIKAIDEEKLQVFYQPIISTANKQIVSCEALVRWQRENGEWVKPDLLIDVAEERMLITKIDYFVMKKAIADIKALNADLATNVGLSINVSPRLLMFSDHVSNQWVKAIKECKGLSLSVEITERVLLNSEERINTILQEFTRLGIGVSLDDFGTGYSGLSYISRFPITTIKIDQSFVRSMMKLGKESQLIESILFLANKLQVKVVAEGVEELSEFTRLSEIGCEYVQGYYFSKALPIDEYRKLVTENLSTE